MQSLDRPRYAVLHERLQLDLADLLVGPAVEYRRLYLCLVGYAPPVLARVHAVRVLLGHRDIVFLVAVYVVVAYLQRLGLVQVNPLAVLRDVVVGDARVHALAYPYAVVLVLRDVVERDVRYAVPGRDAGQVPGYRVVLDEHPGRVVEVRLLERER